MNRFAHLPKKIDTDFQGGLDIGLYGMMEGLKAAIDLGVIDRSQAVELSDLMSGAKLTLIQRYIDKPWSRDDHR